MAKYFMIIFFSACMVFCECAPKRSKKGDAAPHTVYDQQQTGDYNIQLHLKDFQIIAVLGDDVSLGDYDYTYDYSDFTYKPSSHKPTEPSTTSSSTQLSNVSTSSSPYPFDNSNATTATSNVTKPDASIETSTSTENPIPTNDSEGKPASAEHSTASDITTSSAQTLLLDKNPDLVSENASIPVNINSSTTQKGPKLSDASSPGKIKVQILETPVRMHVVPGEDLGENETLPQGDILHIRKCGPGFNRDKRGRCRRVRRPANVQSHIPFGFSRLASNLASRFRQTTVESFSSSTESKED